LLQELEDALTGLEIQKGFRLLDTALHGPRSLKQADPDAISLLFRVAQWVDVGYRDLEVLNNLYAPFAHIDAGQLSFLNFLQLRMVEGFRSLATENHREAIALLESVLSVGRQAMRPHLIFVAHLWKGRAHRRAGEYEVAEFHITAAKSSRPPARPSWLR
jgi:tetratricopeptide (TPR) repeat protein